MQAMGQARPLQMPLVKSLLPEVVAKCLLGSEVTSADAGNGPDKTSPNAVREISFQCKKGLTLLNYTFKHLLLILDGGIPLFVEFDSEAAETLPNYSKV
jgi:hypothetical protein